MIKRIKWADYKTLGNLVLDFTKDDGTPFDTVVLAGENGTGKTTILESIADSLNLQSMVPFESIEYLDGEKKYTYRVTPFGENARFGHHVRKNLDTGVEERIFTGRNSNEELLKKDEKDLRYYGFAYSKARSGFSTRQVKSTTTELVDNEKYEPDNVEDFTRIKQLLIDINAQDTNEWKNICESGGISDQVYSDYKKQSKGYRFEKAFDDFFGIVKYKGIDDNNPDEKRVIFEKHGHLISVDDLSTGEKQIVFRGAHLLRNINSISGGIVLIDEPELSMHPKWQKKILDYYRGLFTNNGKQTVQIIMATHSEYVIQSALKDRDNVLVIVLTDNNGIIEGKKITAPSVLPSITVAETNYLAFGIPSVDYHIELYGYLQQKIGNKNVLDCDSYIVQQPQYDSQRHSRPDSYQGRNYKSLPTYIRNAIDHPNSNRAYNDEDIETSIQLLIELCK